jgi:Rrf2 family protein
VLEFASRPDEHIPASEIAEKYGESAHHLAKVLSELVRARIVASVRGVGGGYRFIGNAKRLTLLNVIVLFEDLAQELAEPPPQASATHEALARVLGEIDQIALATLGVGDRGHALEGDRQRHCAEPARQRRLTARTGPRPSFRQAVAAQGPLALGRLAALHGEGHRLQGGQVAQLHLVAVDAHQPRALQFGQ